MNELEEFQYNENLKTQAVRHKVRDIANMTKWYIKRILPRWKDSMLLNAYSYLSLHFTVSLFLTSTW